MLETDWWAVGISAMCLNSQPTQASDPVCKGIHKMRSFGHSSDQDLGVGFESQISFSVSLTTTVYRM